MGVMVRCVAMLTSVLCAEVFATESGNLLDAFNEVTLESPSVEYEDWGYADGVDSAAFKSYYSDQFNLYITLATSLSIRAIACSNGDIPQAEGYQSMTNVTSVYSSIGELLSSGESKLALWVNFNDQNAKEELETIVPKLTVSYSRMLFELSNCSGYLYGELVN